MNKFADKIILKNIDINNIISKYDNQLTILELLNIINYDTKNIYINKFWDNIEYDKWIYIDNEIILWLDYKDIRKGKEKLMNLLKLYFNEIEDYKILNSSEFISEDFMPLSEGHKNIDDEKRGIHNKKFIITSPDCFKELCMHVGTSRSKEIKQYYIELEKIFKFYLQYQSKYQELKSIKTQKDLQHKDEELKENRINDKYKIEALIQSLAIKPVVYFGYIDKYIIKFGHSNNIQNRIKQHEKTYGSFKIIYIKECHNNKLIESKINQFAKESNVLHNLNIENKNYIELIKLTEEFTIDMIIDKIEYECANLSKNNEELVNKLQNEIKYLQEQIKKLQVEKENINENKTNLKKEPHGGSEFDYITGSRKKYNCTKCNKFSTNKLHDYNDHLNRKYKCDEKRETKKYICHKCNLIFKKPSQLELHLNRKVSCDEILQCKNCNKIFKLLYNYQQHTNKCN